MIEGRIGGSFAKAEADTAGCGDMPSCTLLVGDTLALIGNKWAAPLLLALYFAKAPLRYSDLARQLGGIAPKELSRHLRQLEQAGLIARRMQPSVPPKVEYWLTDLGRSLQPALDVLARWTIRNGLTVAQNRAAALQAALS